MTNIENIDTDISQKLTRLLQYLSYTPDNQKLIIEALTLAIDIQDWEKANELVQSGLDYHPDSAEINAHAGFLYLRSNELLKAKFYFESAIDNDILNDAVYYNLAYVMFLLRDFEGALNTLSKVKNSQELQKPVVLLIARCKHNLEKLDEAIEILVNFLQLHPEDSDANGVLSILLCDNNEADKAIKHANIALVKNENNIDALLARGSAFIMNYEVMKAYGDLKLATELSPKSGRAWSCLGQVYFYNFKFDDALDALTKAVLYMPDHIGTWHILAWTYISLEKYQEALNAFEKSYDINRTFSETHGGLASTYALLGNIEKAEYHIKLAERLDKNSFAVIYAKMVRLNQQGKTKEANELLERTKHTQYDAFPVLPHVLVDNRIKSMENSNT